MDFPGGRSGSPTPLQTMSPERVNQQSANMGFDASVASVTDKISQFNSLAMQSKQLERKTADAALKRAMLGREEAETEMRRYREEARQLRKQLEEGRDRERRVGERLEAVMENYGRTKETHAHTQALWEKEIRRARKETFKSQSAIVKLQEELKAARAAARTTEEALAHEKERSKAREQEAFQARYDLVGCQEELEQALQKAKILEQERDAFRSLAKSEEDVARIASEGRLPLPPPDADEEEEAEEAEEAKEAKEPEEAANSGDLAEVAAENTVEDAKTGQTNATDNTEVRMSDRDSADEGEDSILLTVPKQRTKARKSLRGRVSSAALLDIRSSAASEAEIEELTRKWQWEKQRADRSAELVEYLEAECHLRACSCMRKRPHAGILDSARKRPALDIGDGGDRIILSEKAAIVSPTAKLRASIMPTSARKPQQSHRNMDHAPESADSHKDVSGPERSPKPKGPRLSTIFIPEEGTFRTVSQQITEEMEQAVMTAAAATVAAMPDVPAEVEEGTLVPETSHTAAAPAPPSAPVSEHGDEDAETTVGDVTADSGYTCNTAEQSMHARTPSADPPSYAQQRTSLLSLLDAPHRQEMEQPINFYVPTTAGPEPTATRQVTVVRQVDACLEINMDDAAEHHDDGRRAANYFVSSTTSVRDMDDTEMGDSADENDEPTEEVEMSQMSEGMSTCPGGYPESYRGAHGSSTSSTSSTNSTSGVRSQRPARPASVQMIQRRNEGRDDRPAARGRRYETPTMGGEGEGRAAGSAAGRPHTVMGGVFSTKTTTTRVPLREETTDPSLAQRIMAAQKTPTNKTLSSSHGDNNAVDGPSFDVNNPAMTPTMTREQCLAQIRERRGRARSAAGGSASSSSSSATSSGAPAAAPAAATTRRPVTPGRGRRDMSAPVQRVASVRRVR